MNLFPKWEQNKATANKAGHSFNRNHHLHELIGLKKRKEALQYSFWCSGKAPASLVWHFHLYETNSSIKQLFKLPLGSRNGCKIYEQQYKQTVDGSKRVPEAAGRESLAITAQSITCSTCHIRPQGSPAAHSQHIPTFTWSQLCHHI